MPGLICEVKSPQGCNGLWIKRVYSLVNVSSLL